MAADETPTSSLRMRFRTSGDKTRFFLFLRFGFRSLSYLSTEQLKLRPVSGLNQSIDNGYPFLAAGLSPRIRACSRISTTLKDTFFCERFVDDESLLFMQLLMDVLEEALETSDCDAVTSREWRSSKTTLAGADRDLTMDSRR